jgi:hypothetical protein
MEELQKSSGGFMSVDPVAAVRQNRPIIDRIRQTVEQAHQVPQQVHQAPPEPDTQSGG